MFGALPSRVAMASLLAAVGMTAGLTTSEALATTCATHHAETFELSHGDSTRDGVQAYLPASVGDLSSPQTLVSIVTFDGDRLLWVEAADWGVPRWAVDTLIDPTPAAEAHIDEWSGRATRGVLCGRVEFRPIRPGVYLPEVLDADESMSFIEDPVLTIAADRQQVTLDFVLDGSAWTIVYEVEDVYFDTDDRGCACSAAPRSASPMALVLLAVLGLRRRR